MNMRKICRKLKVMGITWADFAIVAFCILVFMAIAVQLI